MKFSSDSTEVRLYGYRSVSPLRDRVTERVHISYCQAWYRPLKHKKEVLCVGPHIMTGSAGLRPKIRHRSQLRLKVNYN